MKRLPGAGGTARARELLCSPQVGLPIVTALAAGILIFKLGSSSYFIDEANSVAETTGSLAHLWRGMRGVEVSPATYFLGLHYWIQLTGSSTEWVTRLPSVICAVLLVPATWRIAELFAPGLPAARPVAAVLIGTSPLVLQYGQQTRPYAPLVLAAAVSAICVVEAARGGSPRWVVLATLATATAVSLHYLALLVTVPLSVYLARSPRIGPRWRFVYVLTVTLVFVAWLPLALQQNARGGIGTYGNLTLGHVLLVIGDPFWGRTNLRAAVLEPFGAIVVLGAGWLCWVRRSRGQTSEIVLLLVLVFAPLLVLILGAIDGQDVLANRWALVGAPFAIAAIAIALAGSRSRLAVAAIGVILGVNAIGLIKSDRPQGFYADARHAVETVHAQARPGDVVAYVGRVGIFSPVSLYERNLLTDQVAVVADSWATPAQHATYEQALGRRRRLWIIVDDAPGLAPRSVVSLVPQGYRLRSQWRFVADENMRVLLAQPVA